MSRPASLDPLFRSLRSFKGVGPQLGRAAQPVLRRRRAGGDRARPVDAHAHRAWSTAAAWRRRRHLCRPRRDAEAPHRPPPAAAARQAAACRIGSSRMTRPATSSSSISARTGGWVEKLLPVGEDRYVSGTIGIFNGERQITHPDYVIDVEQVRDDAAGRAGLSADPGPEFQGAHQAHPHDTRHPARPAGVDTARASRTFPLADVQRRHDARCMCPSEPTDERAYGAGRACGSPTTNISRANWP